MKIVGVVSSGGGSRWKHHCSIATGRVKLDKSVVVGDVVGLRFLLHLTIIIVVGSGGR